MEPNNHMTSSAICMIRYQSIMHIAVCAWCHEMYAYVFCLIEIWVNMTQISVHGVARYMHDMPCMIDISCWVLFYMHDLIIDMNMLRMDAQRGAIPCKLICIWPYRPHAYVLCMAEVRVFHAARYVHDLVIRRMIFNAWWPLELHEFTKQDKCINSLNEIPAWIR